MAREERNLENEREAREIAAAIAAVEEHERRAAEEAERRQLIQEIEEERRRREEEERIERHNHAVITSIDARHASLTKILTQTNELQQHAINERHSEEAIQLLVSQKQSLEKLEGDSSCLMDMLDKNMSVREERMNKIHTESLAKTKVDHEEQEDETFISLQIHLRGKPNRAARMEIMMGKLRDEHTVELAGMERRHAEEKKRFQERCIIEKQALKTGLDVRRDVEAAAEESAKREMIDRVLADRWWVEEAATRRLELLENWKQITLEKGEIVEEISEDIAISLPAVKLNGELLEDSESEQGAESATPHGMGFGSVGQTGALRVTDLAKALPRLQTTGLEAVQPHLSISA